MPTWKLPCCHSCKRCKERRPGKRRIGHSALLTGLITVLWPTTSVADRVGFASRIRTALQHVSGGMAADDAVQT